MKKLKQLSILLLIITIVYACNSDNNHSFDSNSGESGTGGSMARFAICEDILYIVDQDNLKTIDISTPESPSYLRGKEQYLSGGIETIFPKGDLLFIGSQNGMFIYDISDPEFPQMLSQTIHITSCDPVVASGNYAYVTLNSENIWCGRTSNVLQIYDITNPREPVLTKTVQLQAPRGLGVDGEKLFVCDLGLKVYDITNPENIRWIDDVTDIPEIANKDTYDVIPIGEHLIVIGNDGFYQLNYKGEKLEFVSKILKD